MERAYYHQRQMDRELEYECPDDLIKSIYCTQSYPCYDIENDMCYDVFGKYSVKPLSFKQIQEKQRRMRRKDDSDLERPSYRPAVSPTRRLVLLEDESGNIQFG
jgi:hypothetical protein